MQVCILVQEMKFLYGSLDKKSIEIVSKCILM